MTKWLYKRVWLSVRICYRGLLRLLFRALWRFYAQTPAQPRIPPPPSPRVFVFFCFFKNSHCHRCIPLSPCFCFFVFVFSRIHTAIGAKRGNDKWAAESGNAFVILTKSREFYVLYSMFYVRFRNSDKKSGFLCSLLLVHWNLSRAPTRPSISV